MSEKIDINVADAETLAKISGIGPALAKRIIEYRQTVHPFEEVIELAAVPGISEKMVRGFEQFVTVQPMVRHTAVSLDAQDDDEEEILLLDAPEETTLLQAPEQPDGLLAAETSGMTAENVATDSEPAPDDSLEAAETENDSDPAEVDEREMDTDTDTEDSTTDEQPVPVFTSTPVPEIEDLPLSDPHGAAMPDPDLAAAIPGHPGADWEAKAQRRGCLNALVGATFGAILGAVLTLALLAALNQGTLSFVASDAAIRQQLDSEIISRTNELNQISTRVSLVATEEAASNQSLQETFTAANESLSEQISNNGEFVTYLATRSGDLELRLQDVAGAADTFTGFLDGLRLLLDDLEGSAGTATPAPFDETLTPTPTITPFGDGASTPVPSATTAVSPTGVPTRTPQPTATQFLFPTNTPAPQP